MLSRESDFRPSIAVIDGMPQEVEIENPKISGLGRIPMWQDRLPIRSDPDTRHDVYEQCVACDHHPSSASLLCEPCVCLHPLILVPVPVEHSAVPRPARARVTHVRLCVTDISSIVVGRVVVPLLSPSLGAAFKENDEYGEEQDDGGGENEPDGGGVACRARSVVVDLVFDDTKDDKVKDHGHERDDKGKEGDERGADEAYSVGAEGNDGGKKGQTQSDGMEDERIGQVDEGGVGPFVVESSAGDVGNVIADLRAGASTVAGLREEVSETFLVRQIHGGTDWILRV